MTPIVAISSSTSRIPTADSPARRDKRTRILEAATRVFARTGYHDARISDIAAEAGIAYGLVYHYFKNKEEVLGSIFEERWAGFLELLDAIAADPAPTAAKLRSVANVIVAAYRRSPEWVKVFVLEIQRSKQFAEPGQIRAVGRFFRTLARILSAGQEAGEIRSDLDPEVASYVFVGGLEIVLTGLVLEVIQPGDPGEPAARYAENAARAVVDIFLTGVSPSGDARARTSARTPGEGAG